MKSEIIVTEILSYTTSEKLNENEEKVSNCFMTLMVNIGNINEDRVIPSSKLHPDLLFKYEMKLNDLMRSTFLKCNLKSSGYLYVSMVSRLTD